MAPESPPALEPSAIPSAPEVTAADLEAHADRLDPQQAAAIYQQHGCLVVRGLMAKHTPRIRQDIEARVNLALSQLDQASRAEEGWKTPDGTLFIPAPEGFSRDQQVMVSSCRYTTSGAFFRSALEERLLDIVEGILGPDVELYNDGQCLVKEPVGGHPKVLHQDGAYFTHKYEGPVAVLSYAVDTDLTNGALHVVPGSHRLGLLDHVDTESHLGLDADEWPWERALPIEGDAGDAILFHLRTIHGSKPNWSDHPRPVFIHRYRRPDDYVTIRGNTLAKREEARKHQEQANQENQQGLMVRGLRRS